jgi:hypothetical protein
LQDLAGAVLRKCELIHNQPVLNELEQSELSAMPKGKSTAGPMRTQPIGRAAIIATPVQPKMPTVGKVKKAPQLQKPTRTDDVRAAKAKIVVREER